ncbi:MAG: glycosyltransferase family 1 protein, partial [Thermomicrobiales bacterium]|nr:glycosyltransferase family 1 protein [Thermomicrobiales bacterium]
AGKRILLTTFGSLGDLHPYLALARGLQAHGAQPVVGASPYYREMVERRGLAFTPIRPDVPDPEVMQQLVADLMDARKGTATVVRDITIPWVRESHADTLAAAEGMDLLISHLLTFATPLVAAQRGLPWVSVVLQPMLFFSAYDPPALPLFQWVNRLPFDPGRYFWRGLKRGAMLTTSRWYGELRALQRELGLPDTQDPMFEAFSPWLTLALFSPHFAPPQPDWPPHTLATGFPFLDTPEEETLSPRLADFLREGTPPVVFTLGSSAVLTPGSFYAESVAAAQRLGRRALLLAGPQAAERLPALPEGMLAVDYAPHASVFPHAAAIVHQGGIGTTAQALRAGKPTIIVPFAHDQFDNARRSERLGLGLTMSRDRYTAATATRTLHRVLSNPDFSRNASRFGRLIRAEDGVETACAAVGQVAGAGIPR